MSKFHKQRPPLTLQPNAWLDMWHGPNGEIYWGIECSDKSLTFDGNFICIFPHINNDKGYEAAQTMLNAIQGKFQFKRK